VLILSVADPDQNFFHPGSWVTKIPDPHQRIYFDQKIGSKLSDPDLDFFPIPDPDFFPNPDPGSRDRKGSGSLRIVMFELLVPYPELILAEQSVRFILFIKGSESPVRLIWTGRYGTWYMVPYFFGDGA
jgi:hypothetical protein